MDIIDVLKATVQKGGSDLHFVVGQSPMVRIDGALRPMTEFPALSAEESKRLIFNLLSDRQRSQFEQDWEIDFSLAVENFGRFRVNVFLQKNGVEAVMRVI